MRPIYDGGPAFPCDVEYIPDGPPGKIIVSEFQKHPGMSLRDYFAAKAMVGLMTETKCHDKDAIPWGELSDEKGKFAGWKLLSESAYEIADAMLTARNQFKE